jgi:ATP-dependent Clp protease protease subunit
MRSVRPPVSTLCFGSANGVASLVLAAGATGHRAAMFHARILLEHPTHALADPSRDVEAQAREALAIRDRIEQLYAEHTGQSLERIHADMERGQFFGALEAQEYGLIDRIVMSR